jgi:predicted transposase YbfD/YdcC
MLSLKHTAVTVDALNCQRAIASQIIEQGGDYALALKGNQPTLHADVTLFLDDPARAPGDAHTTVDNDNGRIETRTATVTSDIAWLHHKWPGLACIGKVTRTRETRKATTVETAYYLLSTKLSAERFNTVVGRGRGRRCSVKDNRRTAYASHARVRFGAGGCGCLGARRRRLGRALSSRTWHRR